MIKIIRANWLFQIFKYGIILLCIFAVYVAQYGFDRIWFSGSYERRLTTTVLPVKTTERISLGFDNVLADLFWLDAIQYLGGGISQGGHPALSTMLENTTTLDPKFEYPYIFSSLILPGEGHVETAIKIADKGMKNIPKSWKIPYYSALSIYQIQLRDYPTASKLVQLASAKPGAPENLPFIAAVLKSRTNDKVKAYLTWKVVYDTTDNKYSKERAATFLKHYETIFYLEKAVKVYQSKYGVFPDTLQDLVIKKIIPEIPQDPLERGFIYKKATGEVFTDNSRRFSKTQ